MLRKVMVKSRYLFSVSTHHAMLTQALMRSVSGAVRNAWLRRLVITRRSRNKMASVDPTTTTKDYQSFFDPRVYFNNFFDRPNKDEYSLGKLTSFWTHVVKDKASSMLEYGAGPTISRFITASKHLKSIIAADYLPANRQAMEDWINQDPKAFNWRPTFEYVVQKLEGMSPDEVEKREAEVREKIKAVVHCDVKAENHLEIPKEISAKYGPPFDVVATFLCLEAVVDSEKEYKDQVAYLASLIRPGGYLLMYCVLYRTCYTVGERFYVFPLTKELVLKSMEEAGLKNVVIDLATSHLERDEFKELFELSELKDGVKDYCFVYGQA